MRRSLEGPLHPPPPSRRAALGSLFAAGYALGAGPASAQAIVTPHTGLEIEEGTFPAHEGADLPYYLAKPEGPGPFPALVVVNEIFGIHAYIKDVCARLAAAGYAALAPDYFDRAGDPSGLTDFPQIAAIVSAAGQAQVLGDTRMAFQFLRSRRDISRNRFGITGFCWGGSVVWLAAAAIPEIRAGVAWYGRLTARQPGEFGYVEGAAGPLDVVTALRAPVLGLYAENDAGISLQSIDVMRAALAHNGNPSRSEIIVFPGTEHGFHADYRPSYNPAAARDGWSRMLAWFRRHAVA